MLKIDEKEDIDARKREVEAVVEAWRGVVASVPQEVRDEFRSKLLISFIYHDAALEGDVLSHAEIKAAADTSIISDASLIPSYEAIANFYAATTVGLELAKPDKKIPITLELIKQIFGVLCPSAKDSDFAYRTEGPLHRLYYHTIAGSEAVSDEMEALGQWLLSSDFLDLSGLEKCAELHWRLMGVFPWLNESGRLSRIMSLMILAQENYPLAIIHSIDRQTYYEALRAPDSGALLELYLDAVVTTANSETCVYEEAAAYGVRAS